jgi:hypothetical protein
LQHDEGARIAGNVPPGRCHTKEAPDRIGLTRSRAIVAVGSSSVSDAPLASAPISIKRSRDGRLVNVTFGNRSGWGAWGPSYANTGMEFLDRSSQLVGFYDVRRPEALLGALQQARAADGRFTGSA